jgi:hypothetical protein
MGLHIKTDWLTVASNVTFTRKADPSLVEEEVPFRNSYMSRRD